MNSKPNKVAVLTGDLVNSTQLTKDQMAAAFETLTKCSSEAAEWHGASLQFTRQRGDGWQVILKQPKYALRTALFFRASLKALGREFDTYIGISTGKAEIQSENDLNSRNDDVFVHSGRTLELLKSNNGLGQRITTHQLTTELSVVILADYVANDWTPAQASVVAQMLPLSSEGQSFTEIAKKLGKSRQVVTKTIAASGILNIFLALNTLEENHD